MAPTALPFGQATAWDPRPDHGARRANGARPTVPALRTAPDRPGPPTVPANGAAPKGPTHGAAARSSPPTLGSAPDPLLPAAPCGTNHSVLLNGTEQFVPTSWEEPR